MRRLAAVVRFALSEFSPLIAFWVVVLLFGVKAAIAVSVAVIVADGAYRLWRPKPITRLYVVVSALTVGFGVIDLYVATPFMLVYEAPITNALTGSAFVLGAFGEKPMLEEVAEQRPGAEFPRTPEVRRFFRLLTLVWAAYFFLKAAAYLYVAAHWPLTEALAIRSFGGSISLGVMIALSVTQGRRLFFLFRWLGWLGPTTPSVKAPGA
jgi:intracellular septation protein A